MCPDLLAGRYDCCDCDVQCDEHHKAESQGGQLMNYYGGDSGYRYFGYYKNGYLVNKYLEPNYDTISSCYWVKKPNYWTNPNSRELENKICIEMAITEYGATSNANPIEKEYRDP